MKQGHPAPPPSPQAKAQPDPKAPLQESHAGYAEMGSRQRLRWDEASGDVDPGGAVWGTHKESDPLADAPALEGRDRSEQPPAPRAAAPTSTPKIARD